MGNKPEERELQEKGVELLWRLKKQRAKVQITEEERKLLILFLGSSEANIDELLSMEIGTDSAE